ncbi:MULTISPECIES: SRPBCC family protein [Peptostreptococcales]|uniref:SRPBCC family protein n=1 Tax=Peptostreptococcales TaxID=3082720 RepID=UPI000E49D60F|nr:MULTISPECIES: SRPBCC family protein [Peptostreptococcaceae]QQQ86861.1 SRPBCC family protein [Peptacetobacter hiranonis]RHQ97857.1 SRPBCC family protein [Peptoclostridium sp. AF21-18]
MAISNVNTTIYKDIQKVWDIVLDVGKYSIWRSDLSKVEIINDNQFIEYTKDGYATTFTVTILEPYKRWEFDMENSNMKGHWIGVFNSKENKTQIDFTENVIPKKWIMKPFIKSYLKKQQMQFINDLKKAIEKNKDI